LVRAPKGYAAAHLDTTPLRGTRLQDRDGGLGDFPPSVGRFGVALAIRKFGLFKQPVDRAGAAVLKVVGRDPSNIRIVRHFACLAEAKRALHQHR
jgi:hypothetical protein